MLNVENDPSSPGSPYAPPGRDPKEISVTTLTPEEIKMYKDCSLSSYYKAGLPFAIICHLLSSKKKPVEPEVVPKTHLLKRGTMFFANIIFGSLLYTPVCYYKLVEMRAQIERRRRTLDPQDLTEDTQPGSPALPEDLSYPGDLIAPITEPDTSFSTDFEFPRPLIDDDKLAKPRTTTYEELRAKHRSRYSPTPAPSSSVNFESEPTSGTYAPPRVPSEQPPGAPRRVVKNKYGDEIE